MIRRIVSVAGVSALAVVASACDGGREANAQATLQNTMARKPYQAPKGLEKLDTLNPVFREKASQVIEAMKRKEWPMRIVWAKRTQSENDALVKEKKAVPNSRHLYCEALDIIYNDADEAYSTDRSHPYYIDLKAAVADVGGLRWGGAFSDLWDPTHFELYPFGDGCP